MAISRLSRGASKGVSRGEDVFGQSIFGNSRLEARSSKRFTTKTKALEEKKRKKKEKENLRRKRETSPLETIDLSEVLGREFILGS